MNWKLERSRGRVVGDTHGLARAISTTGAVAKSLEGEGDALCVPNLKYGYGLPGGDGFSLTRQLCAKAWGIRVVLFSSDADQRVEPAAA